jgi:hypothetical protein
MFIELILCTLAKCLTKARERIRNYFVTCVPGRQSKPEILTD